MNFLLAYLGGVLTIVSPCILPVLPFVFARAGRSFLRGALPMLAGMALAFAAVGTLAAVAGGWAVRANQYGRGAALALLALFGIALLFPSVAEWLTRPLVAWGARLSATEDKGEGGWVASALLGVATGLLWAPCAGPILGLVLTGAALQGASVGTGVLLLSYAAGAATSLAVALLLGGRVFEALKRSLGGGEWLRRGLGLAVVVAVVAIASGWDTGVLTQLSAAGTNRLEQGLLDRFGTAAAGVQAATQPAMVQPAAMREAGPAGETSPPGEPERLPVEGHLPSLAGAVAWLNSPPLSAEALKGKVVLVDFWTYSCINCLRSLPYVRAWAEKYKDQGLVVIGVHAPEFAFEKSLDNVERAVKDLGIGYPVAVDNDYAVWRAFGNQYWPAHYFIDAKGQIRHHHFGEGEYAASERVIQTLLAEAGSARAAQAGMVEVRAGGAEQAADEANVLSPETYLGTDRAEHFVSPEGAAAGVRQSYSVGEPGRNEWGLAGAWTLQPEYAEANAAGAAIVYRFHARDLHLVLAPAAEGKPVRFKVTVDGAPPGADHGVDVAADGSGSVIGERLYQLVRQRGPVHDRKFEIRFLDPGARAYAFTFG